PIEVMVEVEPGDVMAEVLVIVKVKVLVCALNSQTTVAVEAWPLSTPTIVIVSACAVTDTRARMLTALNVIKNLRNRDIFPPCTDLTKWAVCPRDTARNLVGAMRLVSCV